MRIIKRLFPYLKPYRSTIILTLFLGMLLGAVMPATAKLVKMTIDDVFVKKDVHMLYRAPLLIIGIYLVGGFVRFFHMYLLRYTGDVVAFDIRNDLHAKFANMSLDFYAKNSTGALISKTTNDVILVQLGLSLLADVIREPINAVAILGYLFYTNWKLTSLAILVTPVVIIASNALGKSIRKYSLIQQEVLEQFTNVLKETLDGVRIVKAFGLEKHRQKKFKQTTNRVLELRRKILSREEFNGPFFEFVAAITVAGILYYAGYQAIHGETTVGDFSSFILLLGALQAPIKKLQDAHVRLQHTIAASHRIFEILDMPETVKDPEELGKNPASWPREWQEITFEDVRFGYGSKEVLKGVDLTVKRGEIVAIVGSSGAGKTTMANLIPRFYDVTGGSIKIGGTDIRDFALHTLRHHIGLVSQDVFLFNESIRDNVLSGRSVEDDERILAAVRAAHAGDFVSRLPQQLETIVGERGSQLSGGERQRISIARALFKDTPILILDEATSSLDSESEKIVQQALDDLMQGRTTFVIAHRLSTIQKADRIIVLSDGKIIEQGSHAELLKRQGAYHKLHVNQFGQVAF